MEIIDENGELVTERDKVLARWKADFSKLLNLDQKGFDDNFFKKCNQETLLMENNMLDPLYESNLELHMVITEDEIKKMLPKCQNGKAFGADEIPNEVLKNDAMVKLLTQLFNLIFDFGEILDKWLLALISSIP